MVEFSRAPVASPLDGLDLDPEIIASILASAATPDEAAVLRGALDTIVPILSPVSFAQSCDDTYLAPPHVALLDRKVVALVTGKLGKRKLLVTMPPRHGKSELCSKWLPAWFLNRYPDRRIILTSYEADYAADWGRKARDAVGLFESGVEIRNDSKAANRWNLVGFKGGMQTAGARGPITGKGANLLIIDDPINNAEDALSETLRQKTWDWYISTAKTRLEPGAVQILVLTRWHEDDLAGRLLSTEGDEWEVVNFPALAEEEDELGRKPGEALWPGAFDAAALEAIRDAPETGYWWSALYQQHPTTDDGGVFARQDFRHYRVLPAPQGPVYDLAGVLIPSRDTYRFQTVDLAASKRTRADFTVISTWAVTKTEPANLILLDRFRARVEAPDHMALVEEYHDRWSLRRDEPKVRFVGVGKQTYGLSLLQEASRKGAHWLRAEDEDTDKYSRALPAGQLVKGHLVWFPAGAPWLEEWESELLAFPNGTHDDQVDTFSLAALEYGRRRHWAPAPKKKEPETVQERIWAQVKNDRKRRVRHPVLGRW